MNERLTEQLKNLAGQFLEYEGNKTSIITVTNCVLSKDTKSATILFTVFPDTFEKTAVEFAKRKRSEFKQFIRDKSVIQRIPHIDFALDTGEKNRQRIEELLEEENGESKI